LQKSTSFLTWNSPPSGAVKVLMNTWRQH